LSWSAAGQQEIQVARVFGSSSIGPKAMEHFRHFGKVVRVRLPNPDMLHSDMIGALFAAGFERERLAIAADGN